MYQQALFAISMKSSGWYVENFSKEKKYLSCIVLQYGR